jgi:hypothetical protein
MKKAAGAKQTARARRDFALAHPEGHEDFPWGERLTKVKGKVFLFLGHQERTASCPLDVLQQSIDESHRAVAPERLAAQPP